MIRFFVLILLFFLPICLSAQVGLQTENVLGVQELVRDIFIKGSCRNVSSISGIGDETISRGEFSNAANILDIGNGIILSTGNIALAQGPNRDNEASQSLDVISNDPDLTRLATGTLYDVAGIEFDFVPLNNRVTFEYVFASEEYCEFVGTQFNDVFGFFVSGPGINGTFANNAINLATLPGTSDDVSINTINHLLNERFYINNGTNVNSTGDCGIITRPAAPELIEFDGYTVPLLATLEVIPCETYHIRLVIGDVGDARLDSAVFLESNSFDLGEPISVRAEVEGTDEAIAFESCVDGRFVFTRSVFNNINEDFLVEFNISPQSSAVMGVDYVDIPLSVVIPAGETFVALPIEIIEDNIIEGPESIMLELVYECDCIDPTSVSYTHLTLPTICSV